MLNVFISKNLLNCTILSCYLFSNDKIVAACHIQNDCVMDYSGHSNTSEVPQVAGVGKPNRFSGVMH